MDLKVNCTLNYFRATLLRQAHDHHRTTMPDGGVRLQSAARGKRNGSGTGGAKAWTSVGVQTEACGGAIRRLPGFSILRRLCLAHEGRLVLGFGAPFPLSISPSTVQVPLQDEGVCVYHTPNSHG